MAHAHLPPSRLRVIQHICIRCNDQGRRNHRERERKRKGEEAAHRAKRKLKRKQENKLTNAGGVNETDTVRPSMDGGSKVAGPPLMSAPTLHTYPPGLSSSLECSYSSRNPVSSSRTVTRTSSFTSSYTSSHASCHCDLLDLDPDKLLFHTPQRSIVMIDSSRTSKRNHLLPRHTPRCRMSWSTHIQTHIQTPVQP